MAVNIQAFLRKIEQEPSLRKGLTDLIEAAWADKQNGRMSYDEFLEWADEDTLAEWVDGEVSMSSPASYRHQDIGDFLTSILRIYVETHNLGIISSAPFQMKMEISGREPDILFLRRDHLERLKPRYLDGPADLAVEIISPESVERDRGTKFIEYETAGIPEYWLIHPIRQWMECYQLGDEGCYNTVFAGNNGVVSRTWNLWVVAQG